MHGGDHKHGKTTVSHYAMTTKSKAAKHEDHFEEEFHK
jgi:hypothetical protein